MRGSFRDLTGKRFGLLLVEKIAEKRKRSRGSSRVYWFCKCDCGTYRIVRADTLTESRTVSCGCLQRQRTASVAERFNLKHGQARKDKKSLLYSKWTGIKARCNNPNSTGYKYYGGIGIKCLWDSFEEFRDDMEASFLIHLDKHGQRDTTIDRKNPFGHYSGENCQWATRRQQAWNKRDSYALPR